MKIQNIEHYQNIGMLLQKHNFLGRDVETIITEVNNTPWGEKYCYVLSDPTKTQKNNLKYFNKLNKLNKKYSSKSIPNEFAVS